MAKRHWQRQRDVTHKATQVGAKLVIAAAAGWALAATSVAHADAIIGDWEDTTDGWIDWSNGQAPIGPPKFSYDTVGVTSGNKSLKLMQAGWGQNLSLKLQLFSNGVKEYRPDFFANTQFSFDLTLPAQSTAGWSEIYALAINAQNYGFINESPIPKFHVDYGATGGAQQTSTVTFDYARLVDGDTSNGEIAPSAAYVEFILATNSTDADHGVFYFDKARFTSPNLRVDLNGGGAGSGHPNQAGFNGWDDLPTSGQNGNGAQFNYPTASATKSFTSFSHASGAIQTTLTSVDVVAGPGGPTYLTGPTPEDAAKLNARDMSIPGAISTTAATSRRRRTTSTETSSSPKPAPQRPVPVRTTASR